MSSWYHVGALLAGAFSVSLDTFTGTARLTLDLMMVLWMPLSLILMVICLSDRSGLIKGGWILTRGFFLGSSMYLKEKKEARMNLPV